MTEAAAGLLGSTPWVATEGRHRREKHPHPEDTAAIILLSPSKLK
jgi:hypothetical protein